MTMTSPNLVLLLLNTAVLSGSCSQYDLVLSNDGPISTGAQGTVEAKLLSRAGSRPDTVQDQDHPYLFHWDLQYPLAVVRKSEHELSCSITVQSLTPNVYALHAWVTQKWCSWCPPIARGSTKLLVTASVVGTLSLTQPNGSITSTSKEYELATKTPTKISFILYDPSDYFNTASFRYFWQFGDGERMVTNESYTLHTYPTPGIYQLHVDVLAHLNHSQQKTGVYGASLRLLDTIKKIEVKSIEESYRMNFYLYIDGRCHPVELLRSSVYNLSYTFTELGPYTFNVRAENSVSTLQACYKITTWQSGTHPVWFIVPCVTVFTIILLFILSSAMRKGSARRDLVEVADFDFSPVADKPVKEARVLSRRTIRICCIPCLPAEDELRSLSGREIHSLLKNNHTQLQDYSQRPEMYSFSTL